jgi:uncharacterized protein YdbL (DUF1318 family)
MKRILALGMIALLAMGSAAYALDLDGAKAQGLVGERRDGYLGVVAGGGEVQTLVASINAKRKEEYARIAAGNKQPIATVEKLAAAKAIQMTKPGHFVMDAGGNWVKK